MEISKEFAEKQYLLHKQEADKWDKIIKSFTSQIKNKLTKQEREIIAETNIKAYHANIRKRKQQH